MLDVKKVQEEAQAELQKEKVEAAKKQVKTKLMEIEKAQKVVSNLQRELEDLYATLA